MKNKFFIRPKLKNFRGKKGEDALHENFIYIVLAVVFIGICIAFILIKSSPESLLAQKTAKQIALIIDAARPETEISLDVKEQIDKAIENNVEFPIQIDNDKNLVTIRLGEKSFYEYSFFNDVYVNYKIENGVLKLKII